MNIDDLTLGQIKEIQSMADGRTKSPAHPYIIGQAYMICTVTRYYTGTLRQVTEHELVLEDAAWIAHTGRYNEALTTGELTSVEPIPHPVIIGRGSVVEASHWVHDLPKKVK